MIDAYRDAGGRGPAAPAGAPELGARPARGRGDRARAVAQQRLPAAGLLGHRQRRDLRRRVRARHGRAGRQTVHVSADLGRHAAQLAEYAELGFDEIALHHVGQQQDAFVDAFGAKVLPQLRSMSGERGMRLTRTSDLWWKNAVVYCLDVETYADGNGDGCGDFRGLIQNIDHLDRLGVTCLWLMPFYPSPDRDDGYDITDFYGVDPRLGTAGDVVELVRTARDRGHAGDRRPGGQPHLGRAPVVRRGPQQPRLPQARLVRLAGRAAGRRRAGRGVPRPGDQPLGATTRRPSSTTCTSSTSTSPTSTSPTRRSATRSPGSWATGWSWGCPASGWTRCRS